MTVDDDLGGGPALDETFRRGHPELMAMHYQKIESLDPHLDDFRNPGTHIEAVGVAEDGQDRRNRLELGEDVGGTDVAGVQDAIDIAEDFEHFGTEETVGIGDDA